MSDSLLSIEGLVVSYKTEGLRRPVLRDISLEIERGEVLGIVGESGSGKSTLLFAIMRYLTSNAVIESGAIRLEGLDLLRASREALGRLHGRRIAMVYQDPAQALNPAMRIGAQIAEVRRYHFGEPEVVAGRRALALLTDVGIEAPDRIATSYPHQLSGGQQQRAMIAMALAGEPALLLMDEPTTALDVVVQARLLELIRELKRRTGVSVLFVSHDINVVDAIADRIGVLYAGDLMELGPAKAVLRRSRNPYTLGLLAGIPRIDQRVRLRAIPGSPGARHDADDTCVFADRCAVAEPLCRATRPPLVEAAGRLSRCHFANDPARFAMLSRSEPLAVNPSSSTASPTSLLLVSGLSVDYGRRGLFRRDVVHAVRDVSFALRRERVLAIVGESGSGKSTLARTLLRLQRKVAGAITFEGQDVFSLTADALRRFRQRVQIVFQNPASSLNPRKTVGELVARPLLLAGVPAERARERAATMLAAVGIDQGMVARRPRELSGGEKQRVAIARAFVTEPALVILDEPTSSLDASVQASILELLDRLKIERRCAYLLITHDLAVVRQAADEVIVMQAGEVRESGPVEAVFSEPRHSYTRSLMSSVQKL